MGPITYLRENHVVPLLAPAADRYNTDPKTRGVRRSASRVKSFLVYANTAGTNTGTAKLQVVVGDDASLTNPVAVDFRWRKTGNANDVKTDVAYTAAATGVTTTANQEAVYELIIVEDEINASNVEAKPFIGVQLTEVVNDPVTGCVMCVLSDLVNKQQTHDTVLS